MLVLKTLTLGRIHQGLGQHELALGVYEEALTHHPQHADLLFGLGRACVADAQQRLSRASPARSLS